MTTKSIDNVLEENPKAPGDFMIRMYSQEYGYEEFSYSTHEEMREGLERLKESCLKQKAQDGIDRELEAFICLGAWDTEEPWDSGDEGAP